jgi:hypothetical protein
LREEARTSHDSAESLLSLSEALRKHPGTHWDRGDHIVSTEHSASAYTVRVSTSEPALGQVIM